MTPNDLLTKQDLEKFKKELFDLLKPLTESKQASNISNGTLHHLRVTGALAARKMGSIYFYSAEDIDKELNRVEKRLKR